MAPLTSRAARDAAIARARSSSSRASRDAAIARVRNARGNTAPALLGITAARAKNQSTPIGDALGTTAGGLLDYVSRPAFMVADAIQGDFGSMGKNALNLILPGSQSIEKLAGSRELVSQALEQKGVKFGGGIPGFLGRFAVDVATDPLTYLSFGTASGLKGAGQIGRSAMDAAVAGGALSSREIARLQSIGRLTPEQADIARIQTSARIGAEREQATKAWLAQRGGQGVVFGFRPPTTAVRAINRATGAKLKTVYPVAESKAAAKVLNKAGVSLSGARGVPALRALIEAAGGEDKGAYQAMLGAINTVNFHKSRFDREARAVERAINKSGAANGVKRYDSSPTVSHLYDAPEVARRGQQMVQQLTKQLARATDEAEVAELRAQIQSLPTDTRSAYEWLRANHNHGSRFQFPEFEQAVRAFGNPDNIADGSALAMVREQSRRLEDYADTAGVMYDKLDYPYLTHLPANKEARDAINEMAETVSTRRGEIRKVQEGFTRHRELPTLMDWYMAERSLGVKMVPELSVGRRLAVRGVSGASEAMHAVLMRELVKLYGARGPLPDMDELEDMLDGALRQLDKRQDKLSGMLNRSSSPIAKQAMSDYARLRQQRIAASKALADAKKNARKDKATVADAQAVKTAEKMLADIDAQIEAVKKAPRVPGVAPVDLDAARASKIAEATQNLNIAQADRAAAAKDMADRIMGAALRKIEDVKSRFRSGDNTDGGPGVFDNPGQEAEALQNEQLNQARQEVERLEAELNPVVTQVARWMRATIQKTNADARRARKGLQDPKIARGKARAALKREQRKGDKADQERLAELQDEVAYYEEQVEIDRQQGVHTAGINDRLWDGRTKSDVEEIQRRGQNTTRSRKGSGKGTNQGDGKKSIADYYDDAMEALLELRTVPDVVANPTVKAARAITQEEWDAARQQILELRAAQDIADELDSGTGPLAGYTDDDIPAEFGPDPDAADVFQPVEVPAAQRVPEGETINVPGQPSDIIPPTPIDQLPWSQRQVVKLMRQRFGSPPDLSRPWVSVKQGERGFSIRVGNKTYATNQDELLGMEADGWIVAERRKDGSITRIKPGPELQAEKMAMGRVEDAVRENTIEAISEAGAREVGAAERAVDQASQPVTPSQRKIAELEARLQTAVAQGKADVVAAGELADLKVKKKAARDQLREAKKTAQAEVVEPAQRAYDELVQAEAALREFIGVIKTPPNARKVAAATRARDKASKQAQRAENTYANAEVANEAAQAYIQSLYRADASYDEALRATGYVRDGADWARIQGQWKVVTDRYIPGSSRLDPNAQTRFDPAVAPQIVNIVDRINESIKTQNAWRKVIRFTTGITRAWKALVLATPGYHMRNMVDDGLRAFWAGARNPASFYQAVRIMQGKAKTIKIRGEVYTRDEIMSMANVHGIIGTGSQYHSEVGPAYERVSTRGRRLGIPMPRKIGSGAIVTTSQVIGEMRENMTRLGTFIELLRNGEDEVTAAKNVRDFLFDYNDTSNLIRSAKDFWSPFITYSLKAVPFYAKTAVQRPGQLANLNKFMRDMTQTATVDYPGEVTMEYMAPGQELAFAIPRIPGVSDALFGKGRPGAVDPSNLMGISAIDQLSPITFPKPEQGETAIGAALGTIPRGTARVAAGMGNPIARYLVELGTQQDMRYGSPLPTRTRLTPVPLAAQRLLSAVSGGKANIPGYGMKTDAFSGEQVEAASTNLLRFINLFPPIGQAGSYATLTGGLGFDNPFVNESDAGRISFVRTFSGIPIRPLDVSRAQFFATRRQ